LSQSDGSCHRLLLWLPARAWSSGRPLPWRYLTVERSAAAAASLSFEPGHPCRYSLSIHLDLCGLFLDLCGYLLWQLDGKHPVCHLGADLGWHYLFRDGYPPVERPVRALVVNIVLALLFRLFGLLAGNFNRMLACLQIYLFLFYAGHLHLEFVLVALVHKVTQWSPYVVQNARRQEREPPVKNRRPWPRECPLDVPFNVTSECFKYICAPWKGCFFSSSFFFLFFLSSCWFRNLRCCHAILS